MLWIKWTGIVETKRKDVVPIPVPKLNVDNWLKDLWRR